MLFGCFRGGWCLLLRRRRLGLLLLMLLLLLVGLLRCSLSLGFSLKSLFLLTLFLSTSFRTAVRIEQLGELHDSLEVFLGQIVVGKYEFELRVDNLLEEIVQTREARLWEASRPRPRCSL